MSAVLAGNDPKTCSHIYPITRDGRCHGCGSRAPLQLDELAQLGVKPLPVDDPANVRTRTVVAAVRAIDALQLDRGFELEQLGPAAQQAVLALREAVRALRSLR